MILCRAQCSLPLFSIYFFFLNSIELGLRCRCASSKFWRKLNLKRLPFFILLNTFCAKLVFIVLRYDGMLNSCLANNTTKGVFIEATTLCNCLLNINYNFFEFLKAFTRIILINFIMNCQKPTLNKISNVSCASDNI